MIVVKSTVSPATISEYALTTVWGSAVSAVHMQGWRWKAKWSIYAKEIHELYSDCVTVINILLSFLGVWHFLWVWRGVEKESKSSFLHNNCNNYGKFWSIFWNHTFLFFVSISRTKQRTGVPGVRLCCCFSRNGFFVSWRWFSEEDSQPRMSPRMRSRITIPANSPVLFEPHVSFTNMTSLKDNVKHKTYLYLLLHGLCFFPTCCTHFHQDHQSQSLQYSHNSSLIPW